MRYWKNLLNDKNVAAVAPSSGFLIRRVLNRMPRFETRETHILELGAGDGPLTTRILRKMTSDSHLSVFEPNPYFFSKLEKIKDNRLSLFQDVAERVAEYPEIMQAKYDYVLASFPFSKLKNRHAFFELITGIMNPAGELIIFNQYIPFGLSKDLTRFFSCVSVETEWFNIPPCLNFFAGGLKKNQNGLF